jgi:hypothetical protein
MVFRSKPIENLNSRGNPNVILITITVAKEIIRQYGLYFCFTYEIDFLMDVFLAG